MYAGNRVTVLGAMLAGLVISMAVGAQTPQLPSTNPLQQLLVPRPFFAGAVVYPSSSRSFMLLKNVANVEFLRSTCSSPRGNYICELADMKLFFASAGGVAADRCENKPPNLECRLVAPAPVAAGSSITVQLGRFNIASRNPSTTRTFAITQCAPDLRAVGTTDKVANGFVISGTGLTPPPDARLQLAAEEFAQGMPIGTIPVALVATGTGTLTVRLEHPNLAAKNLRFFVSHDNCIGWSEGNLSVVFREAGQASPLAARRSDSIDFLMPGASDANLAIDAQARMLSYNDRLATSQPDPLVRVGDRQSLRKHIINRGSSPVSGITVQFRATGPVAWGRFTSGAFQDIVAFDAADPNSTIPVTCPVKTTDVIACQLGAVPPGRLIELRARADGQGRTDASAKVEFRAYGAGLTEQYYPAVVQVDYDADNTADRGVAANAASRVVAGTNYSVAEWSALVHPVRAEVFNAGPAAVNGLNVIVTVVSGYTGNAVGGSWTPQFAALPAGCTSASNAQYSIAATCHVSLPAGQRTALDFPVRMLRNDVIFPTGRFGADASSYGQFIAYSVAVDGGSAPLDPDDTNQYSTGTATLCATAWEPSEPAGGGTYLKLRCRP